MRTLYPIKAPEFKNEIVQLLERASDLNKDTIKNSIGTYPKRQPCSRHQQGHHSLKFILIFNRKRFCVIGIQILHYNRYAIG